MSMQNYNKDLWPHGFSPDTRGPNTYLHAGSSKGWPADHSAEDTFDIPPREFVMHPNYTVGNATPENTFTTKEYAAVFDGKGCAQLVLNHDTQTIIAHFDTFADAQLAAEALNNHKGY